VHGVGVHLNTMQRTDYVSAEKFFSKDGPFHALLRQLLRFVPAKKYGDVDIRSNRVFDFKVIHGFFTLSYYTCDHFLGDHGHYNSIPVIWKVPKWTVNMGLMEVALGLVGSAREPNPSTQQMDNFIAYTRPFAGVSENIEEF
jgi:hypothetical protein